MLFHGKSRRGEISGEQSYTKGFTNSPNHRRIVKPRLESSSLTSQNAKRNFRSWKREVQSPPPMATLLSTAAKGSVCVEGAAESGLRVVWCEKKWLGRQSDGSVDRGASRGVGVGAAGCAWGASAAGAGGDADSSWREDHLA
ncbi:hypothetical protein Tco_1437903 [Tanacetum coccineum]